MVWVIYRREKSRQEHGSDNTVHEPVLEQPEPSARQDVDLQIVEYGRSDLDTVHRCLSHAAGPTTGEYTFSSSHDSESKLPREIRI